MNDAVVAEKSPFQFVAVVFHDFDRATYKLAEVPSGNKPYFYFDPFGLKLNDLAMVHNGSEFGVVRILRCISLDDAVAADRVQKPLLFQVNYDQMLVVECMDRITKLKEANRDNDLQVAIDRALGYDLDGQPTPARRRALGISAPKKSTKDFETEGE